MADHATRGGYPAGDTTAGELVGGGQPGHLAPSDARALLCEFATVVRPGETLVVRVGNGYTPAQLRELQEALDVMGMPFRTLVVPGEELAVAQADTDAAFAARVAKANADLAMRARFPRRPARG